MKIKLSKYLLNIIIIIYLIISFLYYTQAQPQSTRKIKIDSVYVNGFEVNDSLWNKLVISQKDSITLLYHCYTENEESQNNPFLFRVILKNERESSVRPTNTTSISYKYLPEGIYNLTIEAFAKRWIAEPATINFKVDDSEIILLKEIAGLQNQLKKVVFEENIATKKFVQKKIWIYIIISFIFGAIISFLINIIYKYVRKNNKPKGSGYLFENNINLIHSEKQMVTNTDQYSKEDIDKIITENNNLKAEIAALRGQIDAMQARGQELNAQNKELNEKIKQLSTGKDEIEELQKQKDELFAVIIHDIKNPVSLIKSLVELLRSYDLTASEQLEVINDIFETTTKIVSLSQEVSKILALESSTLNLYMEPIQINEIVKDIHKRNSIAANNKNISMLLDVFEQMPLVEVDHQKIDEIIDNLVSNAIKFSHNGGKVRIKTSLTGDDCVIEINDNGLGLSEQDIQKAFQRGARLSARPTADEPSSGLGLWIVKKLVEAHHGRVWVRSALGQGSTFAFSIPLRQKI